jgi:hypothetical protein
VTVFKLMPSPPEWLFVKPHAVVEGWSLDLILREIASLGDPSLSGSQRSFRVADGVVAVAVEAGGLVKATREVSRL